ncbi:MAG TPA: type II toxin-antitoxin system HipA family toxin [Caulobacteraceae bacterium]|nr:type II toxin-antitoxin system HipA family toxin [Caulobacteraceae bacterium]
MARRRKHGRLAVRLNGRQVGWLTKEASGAIDFRYADAWLEWEQSLPVSLSLPLREDRYIGAPVLAVFDNLLPDNQGIRRRVAEKVGAAGTDAFSLLDAIGRDCVGALQFLPEGAELGTTGAIDGAPVTEAEIADMLRNLARNPLGIGEDDEFRISIAGAQEKTALLRWKGHWLKPHGATPTTHIFKPQIGELPNGIDLSNSVENEFFCLNFTAALGLPSAAVEMARFENVKVLIVERFDRVKVPDGRLLRAPQEDCCQALSIPWTQKYESEGGPGIRQITRLLAGSDDPTTDQRRFLKSVILFWLLGATDGHGKNFSVSLAPGGRYGLTPLYDIVSAQPSIDAHHVRNNQFKLAMAIGRNRHYAVDSIMPRHFIESAELADVGGGFVTAIFHELIDQTPEALGRTISKLPKDFPEQVATSIAGGVEKRLKTLADAAR